MLMHSNDFIEKLILSDKYEEEGFLPFGRREGLHYLSCKDDDIVSCSCGYKNLYGVKKSGALFHQGHSPCPDEFLNQKFVKVCSFHNVIGLTVNGNVCVWGPYESTQNIYEPAIDVSIGLFHALVLLKSGFVENLSFSDNNKLLYRYQYKNPFELSDIVYINSSGNMNVAIREDSTLFVWGEVCCEKKVKGIVSAHCIDREVLLLMEDGTIRPLMKKEPTCLSKIKNIVSLSTCCSSVLAMDVDGFIHRIFYPDNVHYKIRRENGYNYIAAGSFHNFAIRNGKIIVIS
ncbi:MAG: hypothetical protein SNJ64_02880 [Endomicrobiia bacterium]